MKKMNIAVAALASLGMLAGSLAMAAPVGAHSVSGSKPAAKKFKLGLVLDVGGVNDRSFNESAWIGAEKAQHKLGVQAKYIQTPQGGGESNYVDELTHFASGHYGHWNLIVAIGFAMENAVYTIAKQYPKQHFAIVDGAPANAKGTEKDLKNVANLIFRQEQSGYLVGVIAGLMEKKKIGKATTNTIGMVGGAAYPSVTGYMCGYIQGARSVDKKIKILSQFDNTFTDTAAAKSVGLQQIAAGASILFQVDGGAGLGYMHAAQDKHKYAIGVDADQDYLGKYVLTSALKHVDNSVFQITKNALHGQFRGYNHIYNVKNGGTGYATDTSKVVPSSIKRVANEDHKKIAQGKIKIQTNWKQGKCKP